MKKLVYSIIVVMFCSIIMSSLINNVKAGNEPSLSYSTHVQDIGWQNYVQEGMKSGTSGKSFRLEAIKINLDTAGYSGGIEYSTHVQNIGWQNFVENNKIAGTSGKSLRLEAIKIQLTGEIAEQYDIYYRVHSQEFGWLDWAKNGQEAGTSGYSYRLEAIEIKLLKKGIEFEGNTTNPYKSATLKPDVNYSTHIQAIGWQNVAKNGGLSGTSGKGLRLEAIKINLSNNSIGGDIQYRTHVQDIGWQDWKNNNEISGTSEKGLRLEAIQIQLTGAVEQKYDIYYRVHIQDMGWQEWKKNGQEAGTSGKGLRLEAIEIKLELKDSNTSKEPSTNIIHGIDVSSHRGEINWKEVKKDGIQFAMIRVGYRGYGISSDGVDGKIVKDTSFEYNISEAIKEDISVGVYFFSQAKTEAEAIEEANMVLNAIKNYKITYPVAIDTEYANSGHTGRADGLTKEERTKVIQAFCQTIKNAKYQPMIYTGKNFAINNLEMEKLSEYDLWLAHYTGATQENPLEKPSDYTGNYTMWQYTSKGTSLGINGNVDRNICYKVYP